MIKVGIDLVWNKRFEKFVGKKGFLERVFQQSELKEKRKLAGKFALKEAVMKALGRKVDWHEIEIKSISGKPMIMISERIKPGGFKGIEGSVSHDGEYTIGIVIVEVKGKGKSGR